MRELLRLRYLASPRDWLLWLGVGLMRLLVELPVRWQLALGRGLGRLSYRLARRRRHIAAVNLRLCFPELSAARRRQLLVAHFEAIGMGLFETALAWWAPDERLRALGWVEGLEHLDRALATGRGVLLLTGHFTTLEMGARFLTFQHRFHAMYRPHRNPLYQNVMRQARERRSRLAAIIQNDVRGAARALRKGEPVWYAPDQNYGRQSVFVPFFGVPALTITATARLARMSDALVVPYFPERLPGGRYRVTVLPPLADFPSADVVADTALVNRLIEDAVRSVPEQYLWVHRRFKSRQAGEPPVY